MTIRTFFTLLSAIIVASIGISKIPPQHQTHTYCVEAEATRSHQTSEGWITYFTDETDNVWREVLDERPHLYGYVLVINDNGTPYDKSDDIVENII